LFQFSCASDYLSTKVENKDTSSPLVNLFATLRMIILIS
ncbi:MAG: hypothetical protein ACI9IP_002598, partial [Arcticibacterium sp.]